MSLGYASRLSYRDDLGGQLGSPELLDETAELMRKVEQLAEWVQASKGMVAFTGAGISTACGIPDFRGPQGVWTLQKAGKPLPAPKTSFLYATPSLTHQALLGLLRCGKLTFICSQNVDSLHLRSGVPRQQLAELHGNCFAERCARCGHEYVRDFEMPSVGFRYTRRRCTQPGCSGRLRDHVLDWEDALPPSDLAASEQAASSADLALCLGTSLQITPACDLPLRTIKAGGRLVVVNLQATPKDRRADLVIRGRVDDVMALLMRRLQLPLPRFVRTDRVLLSWRVVGAAAAADATPATVRPGSGDDSIELALSSVHGEDCPLPVVRSAEVWFPDMPEQPAMLLDGVQPWKLRASSASLATTGLHVAVRLTLADELCTDTQTVTLHCHIAWGPPPTADMDRSGDGHALNGQESPPGVSGLADGRVELSFDTQEVDFTAAAQQRVDALEAAAVAHVPSDTLRGQAPTAKRGRKRAAPAADEAVT